jgi:hypothetical protein
MSLKLLLNNQRNKTGNLKEAITRGLQGSARAQDGGLVCKGAPDILIEYIRVYLVGYILCIIDYHICRDIFGRIDIMYCRLPYVSRGVLPLKTPAPLYICTSIKQYNHLTFGGTSLSNMVIRAIDFFFASAHL